VPEGAAERKVATPEFDDRSHICPHTGGREEYCTRQHLRAMVKQTTFARTAETETLGFNHEDRLTIHAAGAR
jgi:hypothetical protein